MNMDFWLVRRWIFHWLSSTPLNLKNKEVFIQWAEIILWSLQMNMDFWLVRRRYIVLIIVGLLHIIRNKDFRFQVLTFVSFDLESSGGYEITRKKTKKFMNWEWNLWIFVINDLVILSENEQKARFWHREEATFHEKDVKISLFSLNRKIRKSQI